MVDFRQKLFIFVLGKIPCSRVLPAKKVHPRDCKIDPSCNKREEQLGDELKEIDDLVQRILKK